LLITEEWLLIKKLCIILGREGVPLNKFRLFLSASGRNKSTKRNQKLSVTRCAGFEPKSMGLWLHSQECVKRERLLSKLSFGKGKKKEIANENEMAMVIELTRTQSQYAPIISGNHSLIILRDSVIFKRG